MRRHTIAWILQVLLALAFVASGTNKLLHLDGTVHMFAQLGLPGWVAYVVAGAEVLGGIGLLVPRLVRPASMGLLLIMAGAVFMHATRIPGGMAKGGPAMVLLVLLLVVLVLRRPVPAA